MHDPNLRLLEAAARLLEPLLDEVVFVGGCVTGLLITSHDLEDAMTVIDGRDELVAEVLNAPHDVRAYIGNEFAKLLRTRDFVDAMPGFLPPDEDSQARLRVLQQRVAALAA